MSYEQAVFSTFVAIAKMASAKLASIPDADIDPDGVFKYVLIRVHSTEDD